MTQMHGEANTTKQSPSTPAGSLLVVDDNSMNRIMLSRYITKLCYQATLVENGRQSLDKLQTELYDLLLLDVEMPEKDGYQVLEQLKADPRLREIPVIMISAVEELESVVKCIELGQLAQVFQEIARQVYAREQQLQRQVQQLRIEIDQERRAHEVADITESEYFQQLLGKADELRSLARADEEDDMQEKTVREPNGSM
jgi:CheY-like chemotaxis protein